MQNFRSFSNTITILILLSQLAFDLLKCYILSILMNGGSHDLISCILAPTKMEETSLLIHSFLYSLTGTKAR